MQKLPEPLVAADVDLSSYPAFLLDVKRFFQSNLFVMATAEEGWAAVQLWCRAWQQTPPASLPSDDRSLAKLAGVAPARWKKISEMALHGFVACSDGRLYHRVLSEVANEAWRAKQKFSARGAKAAAARWGPSDDATSNAQALLEDVPKHPLSMVSVLDESGGNSEESSLRSEKKNPADAGQKESADVVPDRFATWDLTPQVADACFRAGISESKLQGWVPAFRIYARGRGTEAAKLNHSFINYAKSQRVQDAEHGNRLNKLDAAGPQKTFAERKDDAVAAIKAEQEKSRRERDIANGHA